MKQTLVVSGIFGIGLPGFVGINLRIPISTTSFLWKVSGFFFVAQMCVFTVCWGVEVDLRVLPNPGELDLNQSLFRDKHVVQNPFQVDPLRE